MELLGALPGLAPLDVADGVGAAGHGLIGPADTAFVHAMHTASIVSAVVSFLGALVVLKWMPGRTAAAPAAENQAAPEPEKAHV